MEKKVFSGKTLDEVLNAATQALGTDTDHLRYELLSSSGSQGGLLAKFFNRGIKIEAWVEDTTDLRKAAREAVKEAFISENPLKNQHSAKKQDTISKSEKIQHQGGAGGHSNAANLNATSKNSQSKRQAPPTQGVVEPSGSRKQAFSGQPSRQRPITVGAAEPKKMISRAGSEDLVQEPRGLTFLDPTALELLQNFSKVFVTSFGVPESARISIEVLANGDAKVNFEDEYLEGVLSRTDKVSSSFEHIFKRISQKKISDVSARISLVAGASELTRFDKLKTLALNMANKVKTTGETVALGSRSSQERRVIHLTLDTFEGVATRSVGSGDSRKLIIYSTNHPNTGSNESRAQSNKAVGAQGQAHGQGNVKELNRNKVPRSNQFRGRRNQKSKSPQKSPVDGSENSDAHPNFISAAPFDFVSSPENQKSSASALPTGIAAQI